ncbi:MAG: DNA topoisomerase [Anaerolineae bacterium]
MSDEQLIGYCFKCKEKRPILEPKAEWASNGTPGTRGTCPVCGGTIYKTGHTPAHDHLPKPEIQPARRKKSSKKKSTSKKKQQRRYGKLVVVESPAKAKTIGRYLGRGYNVKSSVGHVRDLLKSRLSVDVENDFEPEYRVPNDKRKVVKELKEAAAKAKEIYLATDPDREGEAIAWHVLESAEMDPARTKRVVFQEITKPAIQAAFEHPRDIDMDRENAQWSIGEVRLGTRTRRPAAPFTTSTMQQEASRRLNFGASKTMRIAQQIYEGVDIGGDDGSVGLITYMRTDSVNVAQEAQTLTREYIREKFGDAYVPETPPVYKTKAKAAQEAHEAVRPTSVRRSPKKMKVYLSRDQYRLYRLIWERFVASQMESAVYDTVSADIWAGAAAVALEKRPYLFRSTGSTLRFAGFLQLYEESKPEDRPDDLGDNQVPSDLQTNEVVDLLRLLPEQHFTQPPPRYSEASLVKAMEEQGIGRPSTYAAILSTIQKRGYVDREKRRLVPTETGQIVNDLLVEYFPNILSADFTARLEDELDDITQGKAWVPIISGFYQRFSKNLEKADAAIPKIDLKREVEPVGRDCPDCGSPLVYRDGRYGRFIGCSNFPKCRYTFS